MSARTIADLLDEWPDAACAMVRMGCDDCGMGGRLILAPMPAGVALAGHVCPACRGQRAYVAALRKFGGGEIVIATSDPGGAS